MKTAWLTPKDGDGYRAVKRFLAHRIWAKPKDIPDGTAMVIMNGEGPMAAVLFNNWDKDAGVIELVAASDSARWLTRPVLLDMFSFAFDQIKCQAALLRCDPENTRLARILTSYGFTRHDIPRLRGRDKAEALYILGDDEWRTNGFHKENAHG